MNSREIHKKYGGKCNIEKPWKWQEKMFVYFLLLIFYHWFFIGLPKNRRTIFLFTFLLLQYPWKEKLETRALIFFLLITVSLVFSFFQFRVHFFRVHPILGVKHLKKDFFLRKDFWDFFLFFIFSRLYKMIFLIFLTVFLILFNKVYVILFGVLPLVQCNM